MKQLTFQAPSVIDPELAQIKSRVDDGYLPYVIYTKEQPVEIKEKFLKYISENKVNVSFDIGNCFARGMETTLALLDSVCDMQKRQPELISNGIKMKCDAAVNFPKEFILTPGIDMNQYIDVHSQTIRKMAELHEAAQKRGVVLEIENRPRPEYSFKDERVSPDPQIRWGANWSAVPKFTAEVFSDADEILNMTRRFPSTRLQLDIEHLSQNTQYANIFNFENARNGRLRFGDLTKEQKQIMSTYGFNMEAEDVIFDYTLTKGEELILDDFGYVLRKDQPLVYKKKVTLEDELHKLMMQSNGMRSITPGFQVYQGFFDIRDGKHVLLIGSHMPGITERYVKDAEVREDLTSKIKTIHALAYKVIDKMRINVVELEPQVDDGTKVVYFGPSWSEQAREMVKQIKENFKLAEEGKVNMNYLLCYLK